ncbi:MAG TPA: UDP-N-acetylmuramoyl-L-alanine--D-glutamate ligase [Polyangiales bacterium]|nr:UDP-N-acetylmuramoyl-L-alanine--D-glutamate ligase [Polyangiales bacterium]
MELSGKRVLVVGLGKSGLSAVRVLAQHGAKVIVNDLRDAAQLGDAAKQAQQFGAAFELGAHEPLLFTSVDAIVLSPGVPPLPAIEAADRAGVPVLSEVELASYFISPSASVLGITGTNGKSTVTTLVGEMCQRTGRPTFVGGNLGTPFCDVAGTPAADGGYVVVELSSYQLERVSRLRVHVGALLNITEDHLDRYPSFRAYAAAKARLFDCQREGDAAVVPDGDALCEELAARGQAKVSRFGGARGAVRVEGGAIVDDASGKLLAVSELRMRGAHNVSNACAAALVARLGGVPRAVIAEVLRSFAGLPHRMVHVADLDQVAYYDDSKATNVGATVAALDGLAPEVQRIVLIAGGKDKGGDYAPMRERLARCGRAVVLIGEARPIIERALAGAPYAIESAESMADAVQRARRLAQPGDAVLLAPACASFDMFRSYAHRGDVFQDAVRELQGGA